VGALAEPLIGGTDRGAIEANLPEFICCHGHMGKVTEFKMDGLLLVGQTRLSGAGARRQNGIGRREGRRFLI
jgi:hypothetical protein